MGQNVWMKPNQQTLTKNFCGTMKHGGGRSWFGGYASAAAVGNLCFIEKI